MSQINISGSKIIIRISIGISITLGAYLFYQTKEHELRVSDLKGQIEDIRSDNDRQVSHLKEEYERQMNKLEDNLEKSERTLTLIRDERDKYQADLKGAEERARQLENYIDHNPTHVDIRELEKQLADAKSDCERNKSLYESASQHANELETENGQLKAELARVYDDKTRLEAELAEARNQILVVSQQLQVERNNHKEDLEMLSEAFQAEFEADYLKGGLFKSRNKARKEALLKARQIYQQLNLKYQMEKFSPAIKRLDKKMADIS